MTNNTPTLKKKLRALALALLNNKDGISRESCDRTAKASNSPALIETLRKRWGLSIPCTMRRFRNPDGSTGRYGEYRLTLEDVTTLTKLVNDE